MAKGVFVICSIALQKKKWEREMNLCSHSTIFMSKSIASVWFFFSSILPQHMDIDIIYYPKIETKRQRNEIDLLATNDWNSKQQTKKNTTNIWTCVQHQRVIFPGLLRKHVLNHDAFHFVCWMRDLDLYHWHFSMRYTLQWTRWWLQLYEMFT